MIQQFLTEVPANIHMWLTFAVIIGALVLYATEIVSMEITSISILTLLVLLFHFFPLLDEDGNVLLNPERLFLGFANPAMIAVMCLLIIGQAIIRSGSLNEIANLILRFSRGKNTLAVAMVLIAVLMVGAVVNDTPTCVIFMPIMAAVAKRLNLSASKVMIPLSYASILSGVTTLIGSSTNLLVSGALVGLGEKPLGFFDFTLPGLCIALTGLVYVIFILPKLLPNRAPLASELSGGGNRQFIVQLDVAEGSDIIGKKPAAEDVFPSSSTTLKMIHRGEHAYLPPFDEELTIQARDTLIVTSTRTAVSEMFNDKSNQMLLRKAHELQESDDGEKQGNSETALAEIVVAPASRFIGQNIEQIGLAHRYHCVVLGIQRRSRMITSRMTEIRLAAGDVLLVMGNTEDVLSLRDGGDVLLMEWSTEELQSRPNARLVNLIFAGVVGTAALDIIPIHISALTGVLLVLLTGCLNLRQAIRALNSQIIFLIAASLALSISLQVTGGASFLAETVISSMEGYSPLAIMGALFLLMAVCTNVLSNNATALIFTPIALNMAHLLDAPPMMFVFAVIFASNCCSFATPMGYQTNLLVMAPGHYKFGDYMKGGVPLMFIVLATYLTFSYFYFGYAS